MTVSPRDWFMALRIVVDDVHNLVQGGVFVTRVLVERLVAEDADGATQTLDFSYRGVSYQIDLSAKNARALDTLLVPVLAASRSRDRRPVQRRPLPRTPGRVPAAKTVRKWAKTEGVEVADRGRIAGDVRKQYQDAHGA